MARGRRKFDTSLDPNTTAKLKGINEELYRRGSCEHKLGELLALGINKLSEDDIQTYVIDNTPDDFKMAELLKQNPEDFKDMLKKADKSIFKFTANVT